MRVILAALALVMVAASAGAQALPPPMVPGVGPMLQFCTAPMAPGCGPMGSGSGGGGGAATLAPTVTAVIPNTGSTAGGTPVTISGTQFIGLSGAAAVKFGATNAASYTVLSPTAISAVTPAHVAATVDVTVTNPIGTSPSNPPADQFTFSTCTNSMDFTQACNSQYIGAF
jgi:hypothetical protein